MKEKAASYQRKIVRPLEHTLLPAFVVSKSSLLVERFEMEYDQLPEKYFFNPPPHQISPHAKIQEMNKPTMYEGSPTVAIFILESASSKSTAKQFRSSLICI